MARGVSTDFSAAPRLRFTQRQNPQRLKKLGILRFSCHNSTKVFQGQE